MVHCKLRSSPFSFRLSPFVMTPLLFMPGQPVVGLREVCAHDELSVTDTGTLGAIALLDRLLTTPDGSPPPPAATLTTADRDRLLATVYQTLYGPRIDSTLTCVTCTEPFDVNFNLDDLLRFAQPSPFPAEARPDGTFQLPDGTVFRLPTGVDELSISTLATDQAVAELLRRCVVPGATEADEPAGEAVQAAMEAVAPLLDMELGAQCPECGQPQAVQFSMQSFLLARLKNEQQQVAAEVHQLAAAYRWSHGEITALPRRLRRMYVGFIQAERSPVSQWLS
jgi:hypothetical protein